MPASDLFDVQSHLERVRACQREFQGRPLPMATPKDQRYPLAYPRDMSAMVRAWDVLGRLGYAEEGEVASILRGAAGFVLAAQSDGGAWGQRYDTQARDQSLYPQEDNVAHGIAILARHVRFERARGRTSDMEAEALEAMAAALSYAQRMLLDRERDLFRSTTSVHESALERGFTLYVNGAFHDAFRLAEAAVHAAASGDGDWTRCRERLRTALRDQLVHEGRFVRRLTLEGEVDARPDITLLAPSYFRFEDVHPEAAKRAVAFLCDALWDEELGLLKRYLPEWSDVTVHLHGGDGPYLSFSSWLAQHHAHHGHAERARDVLERIASYATRGGDLPEHVASTREFQEFLDREWLPGRDLRKELDRDIVLPGVSPIAMLEEASRMINAYASGVRKGAEAGDGIVRIAVPHAWTHAEFAVALALVQKGPRVPAALERA